MTVIDTTSHQEVSIATTVANTLTAATKSLSPTLFYDEAGSELFEQITLLPEYYITRTERAILHSHAREIMKVASGGQQLELIELGAGTAKKTGLLLAALAEWQDSIVYRPIDVSTAALAAGQRSLATTLPQISCQPQIADYTKEPLYIEPRYGQRILVVYLGSSIGNFTPENATNVLSSIRGQLAPRDQLLIGVDLLKDERLVVPAYSDSQGITAQFNLNVLKRLNRELGANFDLPQFEHQVRWNSADSRIEMHLKSVVEQDVHFPRNGELPAYTLKFAAEETIHTESSYKYSDSCISELLESAGFSRVADWQDPDALFSVLLAEVQ
ncbi:MAG: L-histidine N(alpha)-methyltransferase [Acidobacteria bacterium]|nr:L-histidine N(alpha)-methyltransferase [Acidobacteriota bacterium]